MSAVGKRSTRDELPRTDEPHACVHRSNWEASAKALRKSQEVLRLLLEIEPGLEKYRVDSADIFSNGREWDIHGMKAALEFRHGQALAEKYLDGVKVVDK